MFFLYTFNQLNILFLKICKIIKKHPLSCIFKKEMIIHDNEILFQYLNIFIANHTGISSDFVLIDPNTFIWKIFKQIIPKNEVKNILKKTTNIWKIIKIIEENNYFKNIKKNDDKIKKFEFAYSIEKLFQKYILYRPEWIQAWEKKETTAFKLNTDALWQVNLWNAIIDDNKKFNQSINNFSSLFQKFQNCIINDIKLPKRIFVIWSIPINPSYIKIFHKISMHTNVYFLYLTAYKNNIINKTSQISKKNNFNNTLEELWGKYDYTYLFFIKNLKKIKVKNYLKKYNINNLLNNIKNNILYFQKNTQSSKEILNPKDNSISINICYSKRHEIEVLYKTLIQTLHNNTNIKPHEIVVTSLSLDNYITHINSIFQLKNQEEKISFYISNKKCKTTQKILYLFDKILNLSNIRFNNEEILEFLNIPMISKNFNISEEEINILYNWIDAANIRWGINEKHKDNLCFLKVHQNTWFYGIEKLLLSYSTNENNQVWNNILSCVSIDVSKSELIGKLLYLINILNKWRIKISRPKKIEYWHSLFKSFMNDFFCKAIELDQITKIIHKKWEKMIHEIILSKYQKKISINILKKNFLQIMNNISYKKFKIGAVNFCHPSLVSGIPFKMIYIIGLHCKELTKKNNTDYFNLLKKYPFITDISDDDTIYYTFLKILTSAQQHFYISYVGYSLENENKIYPSILIDQLINYIALYFYFPGDEKLKIEDNITKISQHILKKHTQEHIYNIIHVKKTKHIKTNIVKNIYTIFLNNIMYLENFKKPIISIHLIDLISFWKHPIQYFFNFTLNTRFLIKKKLSITEPFIISQLDNFQINKLLLNDMLNKKSLTNTLEQIKLSGILPYGEFGKIALKKKYEEIDKIFKIINEYRIISQEQDFNFKLDKYYIKGTLKEVQNTGLLRWKANTINYSDQMSLWLEHLVYCILGGTGESKIIGSKNQIFSFRSLSCNKARNLLLKYIQGYIEGIKNPLLLTKSGAAWLEKVYDIKNHCIYNNRNIKKAAYKKLCDTWIGNSYIKGEKYDIYIQKIMSKLDVKKVCNISQTWLTPLLQYKKH